MYAMIFMLVDRQAAYMYSHLLPQGQSIYILSRGFAPQSPQEKGGESVPRQRGKQLNIRLSEEEVTRLKSLVEKSKLKQSEYLRRSILDRKITVIEGFPEFSTELKRIGVNLNQLTKAVNYGQIYDCTKELNEMHEELREVWQSLSDFLRKVK